jgi:hypothetical protein
MALIKVWESWLIYPQPLIKQLWEYFLRKETLIAKADRDSKTPLESRNEDDVHDGIPISRTTQSHREPVEDVSSEVEEDIDGVPIPPASLEDEDIDGLPI